MLSVEQAALSQAALLELGGAALPPSQPENKLTQVNLDLDWLYTSRCVRRWSPNSLLTHLYSHAFSVPPRDYKPSFPFVNINLCSQEGDDPEIVSLPQGYRLPLLMVAKYLWESVQSALFVGQEEWLARATNIFHISRLCENLFASARVKTVKGGMERGWRCLMFDRFLARLYNRWTQNDPASIDTFLKKYEAKEYNRDVLKHDWKRWCLKGLEGIALTEQEVSQGLGADQFRKTLILNQDTHTWTLEGKILSFITSDEGPAWTSVSELTDVDFGEDDEEVKPSLALIHSTSAKGPTEPFGIDNSESAKRQRFAQSRSRSGRFLSKKVPRVRKSARTASALVPAPSSSVTNSDIRRTTSFPETGPAQSNFSSQTPIQSSSRSGLVVLIKPRARVTQTKSSEQSSIQTTTVDRSDIVPSATDPTQPAPPTNILKRVSRPSSRKKDAESAVGSAKRRRINEFDPMQPSIYQASCSSTNRPESNGVPYDRDTQRANSIHVEVSTQTVSMPIGNVQGTQTDDSCICYDMNAVRDRTIPDSTPMPTATIVNKTTADVAIQAEVNPLRDDKGDQMGSGIVDGYTAEIQNNLTLVVDNLVSSRMISLTRALKQSSEPGPTSGSDTNSSSLALCESSSNSPTKGAPGMDRHLVNGLFGEVRLLREESHAREQKTREEMRALRHLHNVEVDSLRRRLAYLESQSHEQVVRDCDTRRAAGEPFRGQTHMSRSGTTIPPRFGDKHYHFPDDDLPGPSFDVRSLRSPDPPVPSSNGNGFSGRFTSTTRNGNNDMDEDSPLPSKAQRKSHIIAFSRPPATG